MFGFFEDEPAVTVSSKNAPTQIAYGVISCISVGVLAVMIYMGLVGRRMRYTAQRWHVINCCVWGILHLFSYASFAEKAPWPDYITNLEWKKTATQIEAFTRSVFPAGMIFVFLESIFLTIAPQLASSVIFNTIFFILTVPLLNFFMVFLYYAHFMETRWYYEPIYLFNIFSYVVFLVFFLIYILFCLIGSCMCCSLMKSSKKTKRTVGTFADMWLLIPYAAIPSAMYGPSFGMTTANFVMAKLLSWILESGLLKPGGGGGTKPPVDMNALIELMTDALLAMPWFVLCFPITQAGLAFVCLRMWREQFFFSFSCGRVYVGSRVAPAQWNNNNIVAAVAVPPYPETKEP